MAIVLFLLVFTAIAVPHHLYTAYRRKVPTPYDFHIDEYTYTKNTRPGAIRYVGKWGDEILPYEYLFLRWDLRTLCRSGFECRESFFLQIGSEAKEIHETSEFRRRRELYRARYPLAWSENSGEAEVDRILLSLTPFTFRRISFVKCVA